jgi:hypothetical protein
VNELVLSPLPHTWLIDVDGTIVKHNGHKSHGDELLAGVKNLWDTIGAEDVIVLLSARTTKEMEPTLAFLSKHGLRYDHVLFGLPKGERILINDDKPGGLKTAIAINVDRDQGLKAISLRIDQDL